MDGADGGRAAGLVAVLALAACSSPPAISPPPAADPDSPAAAYAHNWEGGDDALLEGMVRLESGCLVVADADGTRTVPVFPTDLVWDEEEQTLEGRGHAVVVGESVALGGGFRSGSDIVEHLPDGCDAEEFFIVHSIER